MTKNEKKEKLGLGIRALLTSVDTTDAEPRKEVIKEASRTVTDIPLDWISVNPFQPRKEFDAASLEELAASIRTHGVIQPLTIRRLASEQFQLIAGERRMRAAKMAGLDAVPAYVLLTDDQGMIEIALIENIQREDLNALDVAISLNRLLTECNLTHESLSGRVGKDRSTVTNYLRLLKLPPEIQQSLRNGGISMGHARALAGIGDLSLQLTVYRQLIDKGLSVRALENLIKSYQEAPGREGSSRSAGQALDPDLRRIQDSLSGVFGAKVGIKRNTKGAGQVSIHFSSDQGLNEILDLLEKLE
jgi:ParB family chromosome partitioning protein